MPAMAGHSYRQLLSFGVITAARMRATVETVGVFDADRCVGLATVRIKRLPLRSGGVAYISGGPLISGDASGDDLHLTLEALANEYVGRRKLVLRGRATRRVGAGGSALRRSLRVAWLPGCVWDPAVSHHRGRPHRG